MPQMLPQWPKMSQAEAKNQVPNLGPSGNDQDEQATNHLVLGFAPVAGWTGNTGWAQTQLLRCWYPKRHPDAAPTTSHEHFIFKKALPPHVILQLTVKLNTRNLPTSLSLKHKLIKKKFTNIKWKHLCDTVSNPVAGYFSRAMRTRAPAAHVHTSSLIRQLFSGEKTSCTWSRRDDVSIFSTFRSKCWRSCFLVF